MKKYALLPGLAALLLLFSCQKEITPTTDENADETSMNNSEAARKGGGKDLPDDLVFYALAEGNRLDMFSMDKMEKAIKSITISGLQSGENLLAIDFRPATGQLYGVGSTSRLYSIQPQSGKATVIGMPFSPALSGTVAGFDFNPTVDRIRLVTTSGQNLRLHPETGAVAVVDGNINGVPGARISSVAYTQNFAGATSTTLYDIDVTTDKLYRQFRPNDGTLVEVGSLEANFEGEGGFDIAPPANSNMPDMALALYHHKKKSTLYTIDLVTGRARKAEKFEKDVIYYGLAIPTNPVAYAVQMNNLLIFQPSDPSAAFTRSITNLQPGESILGIDFRPANGALYALGSNSRLYTINTSNGAASFVAALSMPLSGTRFGFDFNPIPDRIRIISNEGQNLRVHPMTGDVNKDNMINPAPATITAAAYNNNFPGTTSTTLFVIDSDKDMLFIQQLPNNGTLTNGMALNINIEENNGFDIGGGSNMAYGIFTSGGATKLYQVNTTNGMTMALGNFPGSVSGFTIGLGF